MTTLDIIVLTASNLFWGWVWFEVGKFHRKKGEKRRKCQVTE